MSSTRFLEFDSTYRNRILYPEPANFIIEMNQSGQKTQENALDPISFASPILSWNSSFGATVAATSVNVASIVVVTSTSDPVILEVTFALEPRDPDDFYNGAILILGTGGPPATDFERRRIVKYTKIDTLVGLITVDTAFSLVLSLVTGGSIQNPGNNTATFAVPLFFIPAGKSIQNYYNNYVIDRYAVDRLTNVEIATTAALACTYDSLLGTLTANPVVGVLSIDGIATIALDGVRILVKDQVATEENGIYTRIADAGGAWVLERTADFSVPPIAEGTSVHVEFGTVNSNTAWSLAQEVTQFDPVVAGSAVIWDPGMAIALAESVTVTAYDGITHLATLSENTLISWTGTDLTFAMRRVAPLAVSQISVTADPVSASGRSIQLSLSSPSTNNIFVNCFLRLLEEDGGGLPQGGSVPSAPYGEERRIVKYIAGDGIIQTVSANVITLRSSDVVISDYTGAIFTDVTSGEASEVLSYDGGTRELTLSSVLAGAVAGDTWTMRTAILETPFTVSPSIAGVQSYEIENYTRDNATPFNYTGSLVSVQEMCCYEVELINLILPNSVLRSGRGGRPVFHPYMYVELQQVSSSGSGLRGTIYSNNPNANRMLFRAVLDDTTLPASSPFIKIDSDGMVQTIKFRPNDAFRFAVYHPNGSLFQTVDVDTTGATEPNPLVQISACFSFKRV